RPYAALRHSGATPGAVPPRRRLRSPRLHGETRIERLHAHHLRHWLHGGATDVANMVLLCDTDHGLVHDLDLIVSRHDGRLVVTTPDGCRVWGTANAAYRTGLAGLADPATQAEGAAFIGVWPLDRAVARRPVTTEPPRSAHDPVDAAPAASITRLLFPDQAPDLPDALPVNGEPMDLGYVVGVLLANRDLERRLAAENAGRDGQLVAVA
ncbi:MAG: HNH endonuclease, partial [Actinomycetota bacterium]|nr:HNH endonuclease [Actinomycetota bacterium]